jgi:hypothetical protein
MKKNFIYALMSAIALTGAVGLTSCTDEEMADVNPTYNPETGEVNVDFVFNVSTANGQTTRMSSANTQATADDAFRGINNAYLAIVKQTADGKCVSSAATTVEKIHSLGTVINARGLTPSDPGDETPDSRRIIELSLPTETNTLMFWGKAIKTGSNQDQGKITMDINKDLSKTSFSMVRIVPETADETEPYISEAALLQNEKLMAAALTDIIRSHLEAKTIVYPSADDPNKISRSITLAWSDYVKVNGDASSGYTLSQKTTSPTKDENNQDASMSALGEKLSLAFVTLNTIHANELRAGYGEAVSHMIRDLMAIINSVVNSSPTSIQEAVTQAMAVRIKEVVEKYFDDENEYKWRSAADIKDLFPSEDYTLVQDDWDLNEFPATFNLPMGSVILQFDIALKNTEDPTEGFKFTYNYKGAVETYAMGGSTDESDSFNPLNYVYPAELCYFGNSPIRVSNKTMVAINYPDGAVNWETDGKWNSDWTKNGRVQSSTRSVAMQDNINYGTALLETKVKYGAATLLDNNHNLQERWNGANEPNNEILVNDAVDNHFLLTGVLIGGQEPEVGWNYLAKSTSPGFGHMVYDKVNNITIPAYNAAAGEQSTSLSNYSLVWDNWENKAATAKQRIVYIALEFKNNSQDFYGKNNLIRNGATFYLIGKLDPDAKPSSYSGTQEAYEADKSLGITWPTNYALPPYDTDGKGMKVRRVFMQDFKTVATFVIGATSLQEALVSVPDLRSGQISLGLSVDLQWRPGINFGDVTLGQQ